METTRASSPKMGSDRGFGLVFAGVFMLIALMPLLAGHDVRMWAFVVSLVFLFMAFVYPKILRPLNYAWFCFGQLLHHIVTPVVMGVIFFVVMTPLGLLKRLSGDAGMKAPFNAEVKSYWVKRSAADSHSTSMKNQF